MPQKRLVKRVFEEGIFRGRLRGHTAKDEMNS